MNSFKLKSGVVIKFPSVIKGGGRTYNIYGKDWGNQGQEWGQGGIYRLYITAYTQGEKDGIKCGYICLKTLTLHLKSDPAWIAPLIRSGIELVRPVP